MLYFSVHNQWIYKLILHIIWNRYQIKLIGEKKILIPLNMKKKINIFFILAI